MSTLYFAYGSNLDAAQMLDRCPDAVLVGPAELPRHRLAFVGYSFAWGGAVATVEPDPQHRVPGLVYALTARDVATLDRVEAHPVVYQRRAIHVRLDGAMRRVQTYVHTSDEAGDPAPGYLRKIRNAYKRHRFDATVLDAALLVAA